VQFAVVDENKTLIQGTWVDSYLHGVGQMKFASGTIFYGEFKQGMMDGQGYWKGVRGESYQGGWRMNYTHGPGLFTWPDGSTYHGDWHWGVSLASAAAAVQILREDCPRAFRDTTAMLCLDEIRDGGQVASQQQQQS
jgi:hypothetical protein